jgi:hypothetical protein
VTSTSDRASLALADGVADAPQVVIRKSRAASVAEELPETMHIPTSMSQPIDGPPGNQSHYQQLGCSGLEGIDFPRR